MTTPKLYIALAILTLLLTGFIIYSVDQTGKLKAAQDSIKILETDSKAVEAENVRLIDSLDQILSAGTEKRKANDRKLDSINKIPKTPRYDKNIDTVRDSNRIDSLFARYYGRAKAGSR